MFTVTTAEIRWFVKGDIPKTVHSWFKKHTGIYEEQPERTDVYLDIKDSGNLGIKFREGRFEVKQLINELDILTLPPQVTGKAELWKKWSFNSAESELPHADIKKGEWIEVTKTRQLQKLIFDQKGNIHGGFDQFQSDGCNVELTKVEINQSVWWTLGLETYGKGDNLNNNLQSAFEFVFSNFKLSLFRQESSYGYPAWIKSIW